MQRWSLVVVIVVSLVLSFYLCWAVNFVDIKTSLIQSYFQSLETSKLVSKVVSQQILSWDTTVKTHNFQWKFSKTTHQDVGIFIRKLNSSKFIPLMWSANELRLSIQQSYTFHPGPRCWKCDVTTFHIPNNQRYVFPPRLLTRRCQQHTRPRAHFMRWTQFILSELHQLLLLSTWLCLYLSTFLFYQYMWYIFCTITVQSGPYRLK